MKRALVGAVVMALGLWPGAGAAHAEARRGAGAFTGTMAYQGDGIPLGTSGGSAPPCRQTFFDISLTAVVTVDYDGDTFRGPVGIVGGGGSGVWPGAFECESIEMGLGFWHLSVPLTTDTWGTTLRCAELIGLWTRIGTEVVSVTGGTCEVNGATTDHVDFLLGATWTPISAEPGTTSVADVTDALLTGAFEIDDEELG